MGEWSTSRYDWRSGRWAGVCSTRRGLGNGYQGLVARHGHPVVPLTPAAHVEATAFPGGIGLVQLMGRHSGFIACYAALATHDADFVLVPEVPIALDGPGGFLAHLRRRVADRGHAKYIDPSYTIRGVPANPYDSVYCIRLAHAAVHAAMAGRTDLVVGRWRGRFVHVPMPLAVSARNQVDPYGDLWLSVLEATGQPPLIA
ncbi:6-phosphofructokinase [Micromonospora sp. Llam0]|uniref:6-phosphofructokinase n=1 Tax=Micromonospora sp. Llam0 TaxID=2485143 RepID=UPI001F307CBD|nr:6-phosphofructokinase [Micromonospora sp. Llam0]